MDCSLADILSMGFSRKEYWSELPVTGKHHESGLFHPRWRARSLHMPLHTPQVPRALLGTQLAPNKYLLRE